jgi:phosphoribosylaminoimidazolecarboxamide formyltransferase/IMP cyclohydrolase
MIKSALISVFDKKGIDTLAHELVKNDVTIYSTGGTKS